MNDIEIYPKFRDLLPPLVGQELERLEESILDEGIREPLRVWDGKLIDGHNRYEIALKHSLIFDIDELDFASDDDAIEWILLNQLGRRNLEPQLKTLYIGQLYELQKKRVGNPNFTETPVNSNYATVAQLENNDSDLQPTAEKLAKDFGVSERTIHNAAKVHQAFEKAPAKVKKQFTEGKISQKALVESAKPKPTIDDILDDPKNDDVTRMCRDYANKCGRVIRELETAISDANIAFDTYGLRFMDFAPALASINLKAQSASATILKRFIKCPLCDAAKCDQCKTGYIRSDNEEAVRDRAEYVKNGGYTVNA